MPHHELTRRSTGGHIGTLSHGRGAGGTANDGRSPRRQHCLGMALPNPPYWHSLVSVIEENSVWMLIAAVLLVMQSLQRLGCTGVGMVRGSGEFTV